MTDMRSLTARSFIGGCGVYLLLTACGSWGKSPTAPQTPTPPSGPTVTITSAGVSPTAIVIPVGGRLTSGNLVEARTCGMHDHLRPLVTSLHVRITIR
jgi:hypothetical protein